MSGKESILEQIRQNKPGLSPLPEITEDNTGNPDVSLMEEFKESLVLAGAEVVEVSGQDEFTSYIQLNYPSAIAFESSGDRSKYSYHGNKEEFNKLRTVVLHGQFGVAENGAIWLDESNFPDRLVPFIAEKLIIRIKKEEIVKDMPEAYKKPDLRNTGFGVFISGPSKTADIEQSLVYGAHGAKEMTVVICRI